jgi:hypothetical protein
LELELRTDADDALTAAHWRHNRYRKAFFRRENLDPRSRAKSAWSDRVVRDPVRVVLGDHWEHAYVKRLGSGFNPRYPAQMAVVSKSLNNVNAALLLRRVVRKHLELFGLNVQPRNLETLAGGKSNPLWVS